MSMSLMARIQMTILLLAVGVTISACERAAPPRRPDSPSATAIDSTPDSQAVTAPAGWPDQAGAFLAIPDDSLRSAMIVSGLDDSVNVDSGGVPDTVTVDVFTTAGKMGTALLIPSRPSRSTEACLAWPSANVRLQRRSRPVMRWNVGLPSGRVLPVPMDSLAGLSKSDSAQLVSEIARLASTVPNDTSLTFRGLPFRVQTAHRIQVNDTQTVFIATVIRNINQEADARAEHLLLVAGRSKTQRGTPYTLHYSERSSGPEETLETTEVLAAVLVGAERTPSIILGRSDDAGVAFSLLERADDGSWSLRWSSPFNDC